MLGYVSFSYNVQLLEESNDATVEGFGIRKGFLLSSLNQAANRSSENSESLVKNWWLHGVKNYLKLQPMIPCDSDPMRPSINLQSWLETISHMISWNGLRLEKGETGLIDHFHSWFFTSAEMPIIMIRRLSLKQQFFTIGGMGKVAIRSVHTPTLRPSREKWCWFILDTPLPPRKLT